MNWIGVTFAAACIVVAAACLSIKPPAPVTFPALPDLAPLPNPTSTSRDGLICFDAANAAALADKIELLGAQRDFCRAQYARERETWVGR